MVGVFVFGHFSEDMNSNTKTFHALMVSGWVKPLIIKEIVFAPFKSKQKLPK